MKLTETERTKEIERARALAHELTCCLADLARTGLKVDIETITHHEFGCRHPAPILALKFLEVREL